MSPSDDNLENALAQNGSPDPERSRQAHRSAVARFDANVLVVEHARRTFYEIRNVIRAFATLPRPGAADAGLAETIAKLEGRA